MVIETMASQGKEPTFCMGDDIPLAVLSQRPHMIYDYFKQRFAQIRLHFPRCREPDVRLIRTICMDKVTNPAIDPLREGLVMSLEVNIGKRGNILEVGPENAAQVILPSPVVNEGELELLKKDPSLKTHVLPTFFDIRKGLDGSLKSTLKKLCEAADDAVRNGSQLLILSDHSEELVRDNTCGSAQSGEPEFASHRLAETRGFVCVGAVLGRGQEPYVCEPTRPAIPILLAVGAVHQHLIQNGLRMSASIVADTAQCFSTHQFACLIGYGASAVCPYLALETCRQWRLSTKTVNLMRNGKMPTVTIEQAQKNFCKSMHLLNMVQYTTFFPDGPSFSLKPPGQSNDLLHNTELVTELEPTIKNDNSQKL
ncbi:Ferredoxin-dependent glutamate synthase [Asimina triloba]